MTRRILFLGENWFGSCARACAYALRRQGNDVIDVDAQQFFPPLRRRDLRIALRLANLLLLREYNTRVRDLITSLQPELVLAFKGTYLDRQTIAYAQRRGAFACNYYPDTSVFAHGSTIPEALPQYDCVFLTKRFHEKDIADRLHLRQVRFLPHGYDPEIHRVWPLTQKDTHQFEHDVMVIATHTPYKEMWLAELLSRNPNLDVVVWGAGWKERCRDRQVRNKATGHTLVGATYARALQAARVNLALTSGTVKGSSEGDQTTTRTFEIPASRGFMLHERSEELLELFEEGKECEAFDTVSELEAKLTFYLRNVKKRLEISAAGHSRCVPAYSYDRRMEDLLQSVAQLSHR